MEEFWGLNIFDALRSIALDEWEPRRSLFRNNPCKGTKPRWHDACRNVYLIPSDKEDKAWLVVVDGQVQIAMEVFGRCDSVLAIPKDVLPQQGKKSDSSGWRFRKDNGIVTCRRISKGYTGQVQEGEEVFYNEVIIDGLPDGFVEMLESACDIPETENIAFNSTADALEKAFMALGTRYNHSFYWPVAVGVSDRNKDIIAWNDDSQYRGVARIAAKQ